VSFYIRFLFFLSFISSFLLTHSPCSWSERPRTLARLYPRLFAELSGVSSFSTSEVFSPLVSFPSSPSSFPRFGHSFSLSLTGLTLEALDSKLTRVLHRPILHHVPRALERASDLNFSRKSSDSFLRSIIRANSSLPSLSSPLISEIVLLYSSHATGSSHECSLNAALLM